jgi:hypothetical protein
MFIETENGFRIVLDPSNSPILTLLGRGYINLLSDLWDLLTIVPVTKQRAKRASQTIKVAKSGTYYIDEMSRCTDAEAHFSASIVGC